VWDIFASHDRLSEKEWSGDVFVFDFSTGSLMEVILGIPFQRLSGDTVRSGKLSYSPHAKVTPLQTHPIPTKIDAVPHMVPAVPEPKIIPAEPSKPRSLLDVNGRVFTLLADLSGLDLDNINNDTELPDIGIDSLMGMKLARDIGKVFQLFPGYRRTE
jgi:hypothetical protein